MEHLVLYKFVDRVGTDFTGMVCASFVKYKVVVDFNIITYIGVKKTASKLQVSCF